LPLAWWAQRAAAADGSGLALGAWVDNTLVGSVALEFSSRAKTRHKAHLVGMYVQPAHQGQGMARADAGGAGRGRGPSRRALGDADGDRGQCPRPASVRGLRLPRLRGGARGHLHRPGLPGQGPHGLPAGPAAARTARGTAGAAAPGGGGRRRGPVGLAARCFHDTYAADNRPEDLWAYITAHFHPAQQQAELADPALRTWLAEEGDRLAGFAQLAWGGELPAAVTQERPVALHRFYVTREQQGTAWPAG
jgi:GNAT superfamily N-acetyltransferase